MADEADLANDFIDSEVSRALGRIRQDTAAKSGSRVCRDCGEKIPDARRKLGFQLCIECAEEIERRKSQFADY
jgi:RNA polymerase-binding transcription factor DksA